MGPVQDVPLWTPSEVLLAFYLTVVVVITGYLFLNYVDRKLAERFEQEDRDMAEMDELRSTILDWNEQGGKEEQKKVIQGLKVNDEERQALFNRIEDIEELLEDCVLFPPLYEIEGSLRAARSICHDMYLLNELIDTLSEV